jgi:hypothetical protein
MAEFLSFGSTRWIGVVAALRLKKRKFFKIENSGLDKADILGYRLAYQLRKVTGRK